MAKKAISAYWLWLGENRASITKEHGLEGKRGSEVSKKAGEIWKTMNPTDKKKYDDLAAKDKLRFEEEVKTLGKRERQPRKNKEESPRKRAKKDKEAPKRPMSAYFLWTQDQRDFVMKKHGIVKGGPAYTKAVAEEWKSVTDDIKKEYEKKAAAAKEQYQQDMVAYKTKIAENGEAAKDDADENEEESPRKRAKKDKEAPKRPMTAYFLWTQDQREFVMKKHGIEKGGPAYTKAVAEEWKSVTDDIKKEYEKKAAAAKEKYQQELLAYKAKLAGA